LEVLAGHAAGADKTNSNWHEILSLWVETTVEATILKALSKAILQHDPRQQKAGYTGSIRLQNQRTLQC
jgi:hypothetical protein